MYRVLCMVKEDQPVMIRHARTSRSRLWGKHVIARAQGAKVGNSYWNQKGFQQSAAHQYLWLENRQHPSYSSALRSPASPPFCQIQPRASLKRNIQPAGQELGGRLKIRGGGTKSRISSMAFFQNFFICPQRQQILVLFPFIYKRYCIIIIHNIYVIIYYYIIHIVLHHAFSPTQFILEIFSNGFKNNSPLIFAIAQYSIICSCMYHNSLL